MKKTNDTLLHDENHVELGDFLFFHLAAAAALAISLRRCADNFSARARPPFFPPSRPSATAAGFLPSAIAASISPSVAISAIAAASWLRSRGRLGLLFRSSMVGEYHTDSVIPDFFQSKSFKLTHYHNMHPCESSLETDYRFCKAACTDLKM